MYLITKLSIGQLQAEKQSAIMLQFKLIGQY